MIKKIILVCIVLSIMSAINSLQNREYITKAIDKEPKIDGFLNDEIWGEVEWQGDFIVREPNDGDQPTCQTEFAIIYNQDYLYLAFKAFDNEPDKIRKIITRKDNFPGDWVTFTFDSYNDQRTAFSFTMSASGVKSEEFVTGDGEDWDTDWEAVWDFKTTSDSQGWYGEAKIPFNQIKYGRTKELIWGLHVWRKLYRNNEKSYWQYFPKNSSGWISKAGKLSGIKNLTQKKKIELIPYLVGKNHHYEANKDDPFYDGNDFTMKMGLDGKIGITSNLTLNFALNPDFGQVEADPSQVNLSAFETYQWERRPFFVEGRSITSFKISSAAWGGSYSQDNIFYSRRIGRNPRISPDNYDYLEKLENSTILGAFKLTGKTENGISIGVLECVTQKEKAKYQVDEEEEKEITTEPLTNYFLLRLKKDFNDGKTVFGGIFSATNRNLKDDEVKILHKDAYTGGIDFEHRFSNSYYCGFSSIFSFVKGDSSAILNTQTSSARYFQRPDANHIKVDSSRTSLSGNGGSINFGRARNTSHFQYQTGITWRSPELELNDIGYLNQADRINSWCWIQYFENDEKWIFSNYSVNFNQYSEWDFDKNNISNGLNLNTHLSFLNYSSAGGGISINGVTNSKIWLRGGPMTKVPGGINGNFYMNSDYRKKFRFNFGTNYSEWEQDSFISQNFWIWSSYRPLNALSFSVNPSFYKSESKIQYVGLFNDNEGEEKYIFANKIGKSFESSFRVDYCLTPTLSVQYYCRPYFSSGKYQNFKRIEDPSESNIDRQYHTFSEGEIVYDEEYDEYQIYENSDEEVDYYIYNPDYNYKDFLSNIVLRWEYRAGSTIYLVWSQGRNHWDNSDFELKQNSKDLFNQHSDDTILLKFNYWFSI